MSMVQTLTTTTGRIGRRSYWIGAVVVLVAVMVVGILVGVIQALMGALDNTLASRLAIAVITLPALFPAYALMVKRANDLDLQPWMVWLVMAITVLEMARQLFDWGYASNPLTIALTVVYVLACLWSIVMLGFIRGTVGPNRHGPDPVAGTQPASA